MAIVNFPQEINGIRVVQSDEEVVKALKNGETVCRYEWGDSMTPVLKNGEYANLTPIKDINEVQRGDAVFCRMPEGYIWFGKSLAVVTMVDLGLRLVALVHQSMVGHKMFLLSQLALTIIRNSQENIARC